MKKGCWYCTKCKAEVEPMHVTFWETHDERFGGCGCHMDNGKPDVLDDAIAQRIGGADGELVEALCEEVARLRRVIDAAVKVGALSIQTDAHKGLREELRHDVQLRTVKFADDTATDMMGSNVERNAMNTPRWLAYDALNDENRRLRGLLLWALYHHQGGSSTVGQPIREALGIGEYAALTAKQIEEAQISGGVLMTPNV